MTLTSGQLKAAALLIMILLIPLELLLLVVMISILIGDDEGKVQIAFTFVFCMAIFAMPLRWAFLTWKQQKVKSIIHAPKSIMQEQDTVIKFQTKIDLPEYRKLMFITSYTNQSVIYLNIIGLGMFVFYLINGTGQWFGLFSIIFLLYLPFIVYRNAGSNYKATKALHETLSYEFSSSAVTVTGETFNSSMQWNSFHKVKEFKNWFLIYTNKQVAMLIPKRAFASAEDIAMFREMTKKVG